MNITCKVRGCNNSIGGEGTKCGDLCHEHWAEKSSSSLRRVVDDPSKAGGGPEPGDPTIQEIAEMTKLIRETKISHRNLEVEDSGPRIYRLHLPEGVSINEIDNDD